MFLNFTKIFFYITENKNKAYIETFKIKTISTDLVYVLHRMCYTHYYLKEIQFIKILI